MYMIRDLQAIDKLIHTFYTYIYNWLLNYYRHLKSLKIVRECSLLNYRLFINVPDFMGEYKSKVNYEYR